MIFKVARLGLVSSSGFALGSMAAIVRRNCEQRIRCQYGAAHKPGPAKITYHVNARDFRRGDGGLITGGDLEAPESNGLNTGRHCSDRN